MTGQSSVSSEARFQAAEELLAECLERAGSAPPEEREVASLIAAHPELEHELRILWQDCAAVQDVFGATARGASDRPDWLDPLVQELRTLPGFEARYEVLGTLGHGGMGVVLRVLDRSLGRTLALKVTLARGESSGRVAQGAPDARILARFQNEAHITATLDHPGIVPVHEVGTTASGRAWFTMKLVQGRTLGEVFRLQAEGDPDWSRARVLALFQRLCEALAYAHERGVIHRDLKPANVMVGDFGEVYVMDWGLARRSSDGHEPQAAPVPEPDAQDENAPVLSRTREGSVLGTPAYMPPEQAAGRIAELGPTADVYAVGAMLYQLLAGHAPYCAPGETSTGSRILARIQEGPPTELPPDAPPELVAIAERAMARLPRARYADMRLLAADLGAYLVGRVVRAYRTGALAEARTWVRRNRALAAASAGGLVALIAGLVVSFSLFLRAEDNARRAQDNADRADAVALTAQANAQRAVASEEEARRSAEAAEEARTRAVTNEAAARKAQGEAESETAKAQAIQRFLEDTIVRADPTRDPADLRLREVILSAAGEIDAAFPEQHEVRARLHLLVAGCLSELNLYDDSERHGRASIEAFAAAGLAGSLDCAEAWYGCGMLAQFRSRKGGATPEQIQRGLADLEESVRLLRALPGEHEVLLRRSEASIAFLQQIPTESQEELPIEFVRFVAGVWKESDLELVRQRLEDNMRHTAELWTAGDRQGAKDFLRTDFQPYMATSGLRILAGGFLSHMGSACEPKGRTTFTEVCYALALDILSEAGDLPTETAMSQANLGNFLIRRQRFEEAAVPLRAAAPVLIDAFGIAHKDARGVVTGAADCLLRTSAWEHAFEVLELACDEGRDDEDVPRIDLRHWLIQRALALEGLGRLPEALEGLAEADHVTLPAGAKPHLTPVVLALHRGRILARAGDTAQSERILAPLWETIDPGEDRDLRRLAARAMAALAHAKGTPEEAAFFEGEAR